MEGAVASAATGALQPVVEKLTALLGEEYERFTHPRGEIESLARELSAVKAFMIEKSEVEDPGEQDKLWMKDVRELSYDIEDGIDEFMLHAADESATPDGFMEKIRSLLESTKSRRQIAKEIEDLKQNPGKVAERNRRYSGGASIDSRALAVLEDMTKLVGIHGSNGELIRLVEEDQAGHGSVQQQTKIVSVVGSGGIGKTTLARQVYQELKGRFRHQAFVHVSRNPDIKGILRSILYEVVSQKDYEAVIKGDYVSRVAGEDQLITKIREYLTGKRYFIVLDDIWDVKTWNTIKDIFPMTSCGNIKALRVLEGVNVYIRSLEFIRRLGELPNLKKLGMIFINSDADEEWEEKYEEIVSSIYKLAKANLDSLHIRTLNEPPEFLDNLSKKHPDPLGLRELVIEGDAVSGLAAWWGLLVNLRKLLFCADGSVSEEDVETLRSLSYLECLCIHLWDAPDDPAVKAPLERAMKAHPNRPKLVWVDEY
nr:unnamed protein product [Digitaria exilis]